MVNEIQLTILKQGIAAWNKWVLLRASAESVKSKIYSYRIGTNQYRRPPDKTRECELQKNLQAFTTKMMQRKPSSNQEAQKKKKTAPQKPT